ncbi:MAG: hypothetical protein H7Y38_19095 [Armatimonadetes bacterium]|nr:hypothetical protein [Armatimonadota bacterium]
MFRQKTRGETAPIPTTRYDAGTVRQVLARASEIEEQPQPDALTPEQIETLGKELGLSPASIWQSLGEVVSPAPQSVVRTSVATAQLTQEQVKKAYVPLLLSLVLSLPVLTLVFSMIRAASGDGFFVLPLVFLFATVMSVRFGWQAKRLRMSFTGAVYLSLIYISTFIAYSVVGNRSDWNETTGLFLLLVAFVGVVSCAIGAGARKWWDKLPRDGDR